MVGDGDMPMTPKDEVFVAHMLKLLARKQGWKASGHKLEAMESRLQAEADAVAVKPPCPYCEGKGPVWVGGQGGDWCGCPTTADPFKQIGGD